MRGIRYRRRVTLDGMSCIFFYFAVHLVLVVAKEVTTTVSSSVNNSTVEKSESRTISELLNAAAQGIGLNGNKPEDKTFFGDEVDGNSIWVGTWFQYGSYTLATAMFGTGFLVACAATAVYYVLFVVTDPRQSGLTRRKRSSTAVDRIGKIFTTFDMALDLYDRFDWNSKDCLQIMWCRLNHDEEVSSLNPIGRTFSWLSLNNYWDFMDIRNSNCSEISSTSDLITPRCQFPFKEFGNKIKSLLN